MVKSYLRYESATVFGLITSSQSNSVYASDRISSTNKKAVGGWAIVPALEQIIVWDVKKGEEVMRFSEVDCKAEVTQIARNPAQSNVFAVGYSDGTIRLWSTETKGSDPIVTFNGHRSAVTALCFDENGTQLVSGSKDTDLIVWDIISETGVCRLRGHRDQITGLAFIKVGEKMDQMSIIVSCGKDSFLKLWDLETRHCTETHIAHRGEVWAMDVRSNYEQLATAGPDGEIKIWNVRSAMSDDPNFKRLTSGESIIYRRNKDRATTLKFHPAGYFLACHGHEKAVEIWKIRNEKEKEKAISRKKKRRKEKEGSTNEVISLDIDDVFIPYAIVRTPAKVRSISWGFGAPDKSGFIQVIRTSPSSNLTLKFLATLTNNSLEIYTVPSVNKKPGPADYAKPHCLELPGHRSDIRAICLSSDDEMLASAANGSLKIWNLKTGSCIRTLDCSYALCCTFLPGNKYVVVGTKAGLLEIFDVPSSTLSETIEAHEGALWSLQLHPDNRTLATGSADKTVKSWSIDGLAKSPVNPIARKTLKVTDDVLYVRYSPDANLLAVSLLDSTVKVFYSDTMKFFLSLYGHKLPVLAMDISPDSKLLATVSADKNVKLWGLDFGDCHKSIFAHQDSIMAVTFDRDGGRNFFTAGKDKMIKYWDGDKFENIMKMDGHHGEIWALAISRNGAKLVSASHDRSIRVWERTDEQIFLEEEREKELEELYEAALTTNLENDEDMTQERVEAVPARKQTIETLMAGERIMEAIDLGVVDLKLMADYLGQKSKRPNMAPPARDPIFRALEDISAERYVLNVVEKIKASAMEDALLVLPFEKVIQMLTFIDLWSAKQWNNSLVCRLLFFLLKTHHDQIVANKVMRPMLDSVRANLRAALQAQKDTIGYNIAALQYIRREWESTHTKAFVDEVEHRKEEERGRKKRTFPTVS
ncbi:putative WD repeat-containing protein [Neolecta irregularis DAH-3]|uniref:Putative WD repeat-containing protein n=1 Tax=Neolecta irregularis (strain DAH-3) TaxID=1198029 RepID=A0A1U7LJL3_NEOID|nr:putative WD repeat-containing protein [Neolecta irregularis DAH-3]|eukprot:OLL22856.1 putative WD repeat-containing protein [Neolecta irregularis DAH-3]